MSIYNRIQKAMTVAKIGSHDQIHSILSAKLNEPDSHIVHSEEFHDAISSNPNLTDHHKLSLARAYVMNKPHYPLESTDGDTNDEGESYSYSVPHDNAKTFKSEDGHKAISLNPMQSPIEHIGLFDLSKNKDKSIAHEAHDLTSYYVNNVHEKPNGDYLSSKFLSPLADMFGGEFDKGRAKHYHNMAQMGENYLDHPGYGYPGFR